MVQNAMPDGRNALLAAGLKKGMQKAAGLPAQPPSSRPPAWAMPDPAPPQAGNRLMMAGQAPMSATNLLTAPPAPPNALTGLPMPSPGAANALTAAGSGPAPAPAPMPPQASPMAPPAPQQPAPASANPDLDRVAQQAASANLSPADVDAAKVKANYVLHNLAPIARQTGDITPGDLLKVTSQAVKDGVIPADQAQAFLGKLPTDQAGIRQILAGLVRQAVVTSIHLAGADSAPGSPKQRAPDGSN